MSFISDLFGGANNAASAQTAGITAGLNQAADLTQSANQTLATATTQGLGPALQNNTTAQQGIGALGNVLGLNGAQGTQQALTALQTTPGYQASLGAGFAGVNAGAAANGTLNSGSQLTALQNTGANISNQNYNNYVSQLQPYLGFGTSAAGQIGSLYGAEGQTASGNLTNLGNQYLQGQTSIGNANASADLSNQSLDLGLLGGLGKAATTAIPGSSVLGSIFSDERLKEDIEPVGALYDGTNVYRYRYKGDDTPRIGVMAQEIAMDRPEAVHDIGGWLAVDYGKATNRAAELARFLEAA
jgi:hypothetical protein